LAINVRGYGLELYRMRDWSFGMKLNMLIVLILGLALWGCPPTYTGDDDDDNDDNGDDDTGDDDTGDDDTGDDDTGDDDTGDDDTGPGGYYLEQALTGGPPTYQCPECEFAFDVTYSTVTEQGTCAACIAFADGVYPLGWMSDYSIVVLYIYYPPYAGWYLWYYGSATGTHVEFYWNGSGYSQYGYWDVQPPNMSGMAFNSEP